MKTTRTLSETLRRGAVRLAVIEECQVAAWARPGFVGGHGSKRALAILIGSDAGITACAPDGRTLADADIDALLPGARAAFSAAP